MDAAFLPAVQAIRTTDTRGFVDVLKNDPRLATRRSKASHPTLMQCLALEGKALPAAAQRSMATALVDAGSPVDEPLIAAASVGNVIVAGFLLKHGAHLNGTPEVLRGWSVLEEALYWGEKACARMLLEHGATQHNLRIAAALGNVDTMRTFFDAQGDLIDPGVHAINWPFGIFPDEQQSEDPLDIFDNALTYAAMEGHLAAVDFLLERGAMVNSYPRGFHYRGTPLHWTAIRGNLVMAEQLLERGANPQLNDLTRHLTPAQWARAGRHGALAAFLDSCPPPES
jgi:ankyrin repeat protein